MPTPRVTTPRASRRKSAVPLPPADVLLDAGAPSAKSTARLREPVAIDPESRRAMIAEAAYYRAEQRGFVAGGEIDDWLAAEADVDLLLRL